ncbi:SMAKA protein, partial [Urocolius indicus]|nr:SMAKA protein [Urocolius indicus]
MGCIKSKDTLPGSSALQDERIGEGNEGCSGEKSSLIAGKMMDEKSPSSTVVLDYAHRLSHEILDQAVKQWAVTESKYSDIPFIEIECH